MKRPNAEYLATLTESTQSYIVWVEAEIKRLRRVDAALLATAAKEIERLRAIVDKLPKTADDVPLVPGMTVYHRDWQGNVTEERTSWAPPYPKVFSCCYSTREAAEAAIGSNQ